MQTDTELENAQAFALTLREKSLTEAIGQLQLAFNMDIVSAKALMLLVTAAICASANRSARVRKP